jgi:hypothetical protein
MKKIMLFSVLTALVLSSAWAASETFEWSGGAAARQLVLANVCGDVKVTVGGSEVVVKATKTSEEASDLDNATINVEEKDDAVYVKVEYPKDAGRREGPRVDFDVTVPAGLALLDVKVASGNVTVAGVPELNVSVASGDVTVADAYKSVNVKVANGAVNVKNVAQPTEKAALGTVNGELALAAVLPTSGALYELSTVSGNGSLTLLGGVDNYDITAKTLSGEVTSALPLEKHGGFVGSTYSGKAGDGSNSIELKAVSGSVDVSTSESG